MDIRTIPSLELQEDISNSYGIAAAGYWVYFYDKDTINLRTAFRINPSTGTGFIEIDNPIQLTENGTFPYRVYYSVDLENPADKYRVEIKCTKSNVCPPDYTFYAPIIQSADAIAISDDLLSDNLFVDGQFNMGITLEDRGNGAGYVTPVFDTMPIAGTSWQYVRPFSSSIPVANRTEIDRIFIKQILQSQKIEEGNPKYYLNLVCESFNAAAAPLQKVIAFRCSNVLWGSGDLIKIKFYAWRVGNNIPVAMSIVRNFGTGSTTTPQVLPVTTYSIDSLTPKVYSIEFNLPQLTIPTDIKDDQNIQVQLSFPLNTAFNFNATNFYCASIAKTIPDIKFRYPDQNNDQQKADLLDSSLGFNKYSLNNSCETLMFSIKKGWQFADDIGEILTFPKGTKVDEKAINLMRCDGRTLDINGFNTDLEIPYKRLYDKLGITAGSYNFTRKVEPTNWFNATSAAFINNLASLYNIATNFAPLSGAVNSTPEGNNIADLWIETTFTANSAVDENFPYVISGVDGATVKKTTCSHTYDITTGYTTAGSIGATPGPKYFGGNSALPRGSVTNYFRAISNNYNSPFSVTTTTNYVKGVDNHVQASNAYFGLRNDPTINLTYLYLNINIPEQQLLITSGLVNWAGSVPTQQTYQIAFPLLVQSSAASFGVPSSSDANMNYMLFAPWHTAVMQRLVFANTPIVSIPPALTIEMTPIVGNPVASANENPILKGWGASIIYKQNVNDVRTPKQPNILFGAANSVFTYAIQHKALFSQHCLYALKFITVKGGDWIGLKKRELTNVSDLVFSVVIWWTVGGVGNKPDYLAPEAEFRKIEAPAGISGRALADLVANEINSSSTVFSIPTIDDVIYDYYIRY